MKAPNLLLVLGILFLALPSEAKGASPEDVAKIVAWVDSTVSDKQAGWTPLGFQKQRRERVKIGGQPFRYRWDVHYVSILFMRGESGKYLSSGLYIDLREYKELPSPKSYQFTQWNIGDYDGDGKVDSARRFFEILTYGEEGDDIGYALIPRYPDGFINTEWYHPPLEEAQVIFDLGVQFWPRQIERG